LSGSKPLILADIKPSQNGLEAALAGCIGDILFVAVLTAG